MILRQQATELSRPRPSSAKAVVVLILGEEIVLEVLGVHVIQVVAAIPAVPEAIKVVVVV